MRIRAAQAGDTGALLALAEAFYTEGGFGTEPAELAANLTVLLDSGAARVAVAVADATVVGFAVSTIGFGLEQGRFAVLDDLYVVPERRGRGIGTALVADSAGWARSTGSRYLELVVAPNGQDVGHLFAYYAGLGFVDEGRRLLTSPPLRVFPRGPGAEVDCG